MNSNTTNSHQRRPRRPSRRGSRHAPAAPPHRPSAPQAPALEPTLCNTEPVPFASLGLDSRLLEGIRDLGFTETRPIQSAVISLALEGSDLIACAATGTGKTCAFVVPMLQRLLTDDLADPKTRPATAEAQSAPRTRFTNTAVGQDVSPAIPAPAAPAAPAAKSRVLVLAPTRELAVQIEDEIHGLSYHTQITSAAVYGGVEMGAQERALKAGVDIIVATPGRLIDHMRQQNADLSGVELLVLDEADRMMDMGFWPDVRRIISAMPPSTAGRQTLLFSATMPDDVVRLALEIVQEPKFVQVGHRSKPAQTITHRAEAVSSSGKLEWLISHLRRPEGPVLIFSRTKIGADRIARRLQGAGIKCIALHADRSMDQRRQAVEGFRGGRYTVMVATDIAARGLDIDGIHTVINYEVPGSPDAYVHRVGRTGRADEAGRAVTLVSPEERRALELLEKSVGIHLRMSAEHV